MQRNHRQRPDRRTWLRKSLAGGVALAFVGGLIVVGTASAATPWSANRLGNAGFESSLKGWASPQSGTTFERTGGAQAGSFAARITAQRAGVALVLDDVPNAVNQAAERREYLTSAWVRSSASTKVTLRVREWKNGTILRHKTVSATGARSWTKLALRFKATAAHSTITVNVVTMGAVKGQVLDIDGVSIRSRAIDTAVAPGKASTASNGSTLFGASMWQKSGETWPQTFNRLEGVYGRIDFVRAFLGSPRSDWSGYLSVGPRPMNVSFKAPPKEILAGKHDATLRAWFKNAPTDRPVWWTYYHEPENDIQRGAFNAADYRAAWKHVVAIADGNAPKNLKATLVLMDWTADPKSGRDWKDYYAGSAYIDVLGWDSYNGHSGKPTRYFDPAENFGLTVKVSREAGKPFGYSEWGSTVIPGDNGSGRAAWMKASARYFESVGAEFAAYFDCPVVQEYRLLDKASQNALRDLMTGAF